METNNNLSWVMGVPWLAPTSVVPSGVQCEALHLMERRDEASSNVPPPPPGGRFPSDGWHGRVTGLLGEMSIGGLRRRAQTTSVAIDVVLLNSRCRCVADYARLVRHELLVEYGVWGTSTWLLVEASYHVGPSTCHGCRTRWSAKEKKLRRPLPSVPNVSNTKIWRSTGPSLKDLLGACCHSFPSWDLEDIS
jgi:hypothetical protein